MSVESELTTIITPRKYQVVVLFMTSLAVFLLGAFVGVKYFAPALTQHHYYETSTVEKPTIVQGEVKTVTETQIAYVPKETVITKYIEKATGKEVIKEETEKTDIQADIGKQEIIVKLNGKEIPFKKTDDEKFALEKNKISLQQTTQIDFNANVEPTIVDNTKKWGVGVGYGRNGVAGKLDFPIGKRDYMGGWLYGDKDSKTLGVEVKF